MGSSSLSDKLYDPVRESWVEATPEEHVRQHLIEEMIGQLGYPASLIGIEKGLTSLPHLMSGSNIPDRRLDIVVFAKGIHPDHSLYPLLMIECKAVPLTEATLNQVVGYNHHVGACYIALANQDEFKLGWLGPDAIYQFVDKLLPYETLRLSVKQSG